MNGGRKEDFEDTTDFDKVLIRVTYESYRMSDLERQAQLFSKIFGGKENG